MVSGYWGVMGLVMVPAIIWAAWIDHRERRVPNWLNAAILLTGLVVHTAFLGLEGLTGALWGVLVGFSLLIVPWLMHGMGAGDVKLLAAIGAWLGPLFTLAAFCVGAVAGGVIAAVMIWSSGRVWQASANLCTIWTKVRSPRRIFSEYGSAQSFGDTTQLLPYGVPLVIGTLTVYLGQLLL